MEVVAQRGFDATVDEIAERAGIHPRTIFRHYETHDRLIAATLRDMFELTGLPDPGTDLDRWFEELPRQVDDFDDWIESLAHRTHTRNAEVFGAVFWDMPSLSRDASSVLVEIDALRRNFRHRGISYIVGVAWQTTGGVGEPPEDLVLAFALNLSAFATQALMVDFGQTPTQIGALTANILQTLTRHAVVSRRVDEGHHKDEIP